MVNINCVFLRVVVSCFAFMIYYRGNFFRRSFTGNYRLEAIFKISGNDGSITARYEAGLVGRILMSLTFFLVFIVTCFR